MSGAVWNPYLTKRDREVFGSAGYGVRAAMPKCPATLLMHHVEASPVSLHTIANLARKAKLPVIHVVTSQKTSGYAPERPEDMVPDSHPSDLVLERTAPSAFFDTDLMGHLNLLRADGVILAGAETSDAVRATAIDAFSLNLRSVIVADACWDLWEASHALTLFDLDAKHSNVVDTNELRSWLASLPLGTLDLPPGAA